MAEEHGLSDLHNLQRAIAKANTANLPLEGDFYVSCAFVSQLDVRLVLWSCKGCSMAVRHCLSCRQKRYVRASLLPLANIWTASCGAVLQQLQKLQRAGSRMLPEHQVFITKAAGMPLSHSYYRCRNSNSSTCALHCTALHSLVAVHGSKVRQDCTSSASPTPSLSTDMLSAKQQQQQQRGIGNMTTWYAI